MINVVLFGPTASGKSRIALKLAPLINASIISADSRQCFKYMDIGTAKPGAEELSRIKHYNISILEPSETYTVKDFAKNCAGWEQSISSAGKQCLYVGGSTLHLQSVFFDLDDIPAASPKNLASLEQIASEHGLEQLFEKLRNVDPAYAAQMDGFNKQRIFRALDVWMQTGKPFSSFHHTDFLKPKEQFLAYELTLSRNELHRRINTRVGEMIENGLIFETSSLLERGFSADSQALKSVGYSEVISFLKGEVELAEAVEKIKTNTRRYAKRQITWFKRWPFSKKLSPEIMSDNEICEIIAWDLAAMQNKG